MGIPRRTSIQKVHDPYKKSIPFILSGIFLILILGIFSSQNRKIIIYNSSGMHWYNDVEAQTCIIPIWICVIRLFVGWMLQKDIKTTSFRTDHQVMRSHPPGLLTRLSEKHPIWHHMTSVHHTFSSRLSIIAVVLRWVFTQKVILSNAIMF